MGAPRHDARDRSSITDLVPESTPLSPPEKGLMVILDGLGDRPQAALNGSTPLEAAGTPFLDSLVAGGQLGLTDPLDPGIAVDTPTGTGVLFGIPTAQVRTLARGPVEAAGVGLRMSPGDVAVRCNFATVDRTAAGEFLVVDRRAGRIRDRTDELATTLTGLPLSGDVVAIVKAASAHRAVVRLSGSGLSAMITNTDPGKSQTPALPCQALPGGGESAERTARALNDLLEVSFERLRDHPVNVARRATGLPPATGLITRGAGITTPLTSLLNELGMQTAVVAGERTIVGLARLLDFHVETQPSFTAMPDTDLEGKVVAASKLLRTHDVVFLHVKAPDICAHDRDPVLKRDVLERIDKALSALPVQDLVVGVCGDHCTDSALGEHSGDPVPALLNAPGLAPDATRVFGESTCAEGKLGRRSAERFLKSFLEAIDRPR